MTQIEELRARIDALEADNAALRRAVNDLAPEPPSVDAPTSIEPARPVSRRRLLGAGVGAVAAGVAAVVAGPGVASAHDADDVRYGADNAAVTKRTLLVISSGSTADAFVGLTRGAGTGVVGQNTIGGTGVKGYAGDGAPPTPDEMAGVVGISTNGLTGVFGQGQTGVRGYGKTGVHGAGDDAGVYASSDTGYGVNGYSVSGTGVYGDGGTAGVTGETHNDQFGVQGLGHSGIGVVGYGRVGVKGESQATAGERYGVLGTATSPLGRGVYGHATNVTGGAGVWGLSDSRAGVGVRGVASNSGSGKTYGTGVVGIAGEGADVNTQRANTGVVGVGIGSGGSGLYGTGTRGATLFGQQAQLRLLPNQAGRPSSGQIGDFYLDVTGSLWLCKGDTTWVKLG